MRRGAFVGLVSCAFAAIPFVACGDEAVDATATSADDAAIDRTGDDLSPNLPEAGPPADHAVSPWKCEGSPLIAVQDPVGESHFNSGCTPTSPVPDAPEVIFSFPVKKRTTMHLQGFTTHTRPVVQLLNECDVASVPIACAEGNSHSAFFVKLLEVGDYFLVGDQVLEGQKPDAFILSFQSYDPAANGTCASARTVDASQDAGAITGDMRAAYELPSKCFEYINGIGQLFYRVSVPPSEKWTCTVKPLAPAGFNPALGVIDDCAGPCLDSVVGVQNQPISLTVQNPGATAKDFTFMVASQSEYYVDGGHFEFACVSEHL